MPQVELGYDRFGRVWLGAKDTILYLSEPKIAYPKDLSDCAFVIWSAYKEFDKRGPRYPVR